MLPVPLHPLARVAGYVSDTADWLLKTDLVPPDERMKVVEWERTRRGAVVDRDRMADELATIAGRRLAVALVRAVADLAEYQPRYRRVDQRTDVGPELAVMFGGRRVTFAEWTPTAASVAKLARMRRTVVGLFERVGALLGPAAVPESADPIDRILTAAHDAAGQLLSADQAAMVRRWLTRIRAGE